MDACDAGLRPPPPLCPRSGAQSGLSPLAMPVPELKNTPRIPQPGTFHQRRAENPEKRHLSRSVPKWRTPFELAAWRAPKPDRLLGSLDPADSLWFNPNRSDFLILFPSDPPSVSQCDGSSATHPPSGHAPRIQSTNGNLQSSSHSATPHRTVRGAPC
jgi:hypothetical protein